MCFNFLILIEKAVADGEVAEESDEEEDAEDSKDKKKNSNKTSKTKDAMDEAKLAQYRQYYGGLSYDKEGNHHIVRIIARVPLDSKKLLMIKYRCLKFF